MNICPCCSALFFCFRFQINKKCKRSNRTELRTDSWLPYSSALSQITKNTVYNTGSTVISICNWFWVKWEYFLFWVWTFSHVSANFVF